MSVSGGGGKGGGSEAGMLPALLTLPTILCNYFSACGRLSGPEFAQPMGNVSATQGENVVLSCHIRNLGRNMVAWVKTEPGKLIAYDRKVFRDKHRYRLEVETSSMGLHSRDVQLWRLHIANLRPADAGGYMCQINTHPMMAQTAFLNLKVSPRIVKAGTTDDLEVREGENVTLRCAAEGSPTPVISWKRKDGGIIVLGGPDGYGTTAVNGPSLQMLKVSRAHMTEYLCVASNGILPRETWAIKLHVSFPPTVLPLEERVEAAIGSTATLACRAQAWPRPDFKWIHNGASILASESQDARYSIKVAATRESGTSYETMSHLHIRDVGKEDFGTYLCVATNELGTKQIAVELAVDSDSQHRIADLSSSLARNNNNELPLVKASDEQGWRRNEVERKETRSPVGAERKAESELAPPPQRRDSTASDSSLSPASPHPTIILLLSLSLRLF